MQVTTPDEQDFAAIAAVHNRAMAPFLAVYTPEERTAYGDTLFETAATIAELAQARQVICAKSGGVVTGYAAFRMRNERTVWINALYVDPDWQRRQVGAMLLAAIANAAHAAGRTILALETHARADWAIAFYRKNGFAVVNDRIDRFPFGFILERPPVPGRSVLARTIEGETPW